MFHQDLGQDIFDPEDLAQPVGAATADPLFPAPKVHQEALVEAEGEAIRQ